MQNILKPPPGPTPPPRPPRTPGRIATEDESTIMNVAQNLLERLGTSQAEWWALCLWSDLGLYNMQGFDVYAGDFLDFVLSQTMVWIAENDDRTCKTCEALRGQEFKLKDLPELPHPNCRCGLNLKHEGHVDVTDLIMNKLREMAREAFKHTMNLVWFKNQVDHFKPWDIKRSNPWLETLKTPYPISFDHPVIFDDKIVTPEWLGNFTYGYLGAATGISDMLLNLGSVWASLPNYKRKDARGILKEVLNEFADQIVADVGQNYFKKDIFSGIYNDDLLDIVANLFVN